MNALERLIRRIAMGIIAVFLIALAALVVAMVVDDGDMLFRFYGGKRLLEILAGPVVAFVTLMIIIIRSRTNADAGASRSSVIALLSSALPSFPCFAPMAASTAAMRGSCSFYFPAPGA